MPTRTIAVGDIHGCSAALAALLEAVRPVPEDTVVTLGDYINRGPDSRGVIEQLLALRERCHLVPLLGNHEDMLFAAREGRSDLPSWLRVGGGPTLASYGIEGPEDFPASHLAFLQGCRLYHETETHIFVHANCWPNRPMAEQPWSALLWEPLQPEWAGRHCSGKTVVVGHTRQKDGNVLDLGFLVCIDTNCCGGGWLTALDVSTGEVWQANQRGEVRRTRLRRAGEEPAGAPPDRGRGPRAGG